MKLTKAFIGVALIAPSFVLAQKVDMKLNLEKGKTYTQKTQTVNTTKQTMQGQVIESTQNQEAVINVEKVDSKSNPATYDAWYESIDMASSAMGQSQTFSSDTSSLDNVDAMSTMLAAMTGKKFKVQMSDEGMVKEVMGLEEMVKEALSGSSGIPGVSELLGESLGDNGFAKNLELTTDIFPEKSVKVGSSWSKNQFTSLGLPIIAKATYTLQEVNDGVATIKVDAILETDPDNATMQIQGLDATQFIEGKRAGLLKVDVASGWVTSGTLQDDIVGSITIARGAQVPDGMTIPIEMSNTITISN